MIHSNKRLAFRNRVKVCFGPGGVRKRSPSDDVRIWPWTVTWYMSWNKSILMFHNLWSKFWKCRLGGKDSKHSECQMNSTTTSRHSSPAWVRGAFCWNKDLLTFCRWVVFSNLEHLLMVLFSLLWCLPSLSRCRYCKLQSQGTADPFHTVW